MGMERLTSSYQNNTEALNRALRLDKCFDIIQKELLIGGRNAALYFIDGFAKDDVLVKILEYFIKATPEDIDNLANANQFLCSYTPYLETNLEQCLDPILTAILSGTLCLVIDGFDQAFMIDARTYPARGVEEPEDDRVLRGSRDGFVETVIFNTALIRRRMRDPQLTMEIHQVGKKSKTDVVFCYLDNLVDRKALATLREKVSKIDVNTLTLSQESLAECIASPKWYNPFPKIRYTERPDTATANIAEGKIIVIVDNSPSVMILPTSIFDFVQDINDFYFPPLVGTYLRLVRCAVFVLTIFLTPVWLLMMQNPNLIPPWLDFIRIKDAYSVPLIFQLLLFEFVIDGLKLASLNTPSSLSNSFSVIGALLLGEYAIKTGWFTTEAVLYMAFVAIANFAQPSFELGYAFKLIRVLLLILTALFNIWGFVAGVILMCVLIASTKTVTGASYLYPLIPFHRSEFLNLFARRKISKTNTEY